MSVSLNRVEDNKNYFIKYYGEKRPLWKYYLRSFLDLVGVPQPVEYYNRYKRLNFEYDVLNLWSRYGLNIPKVIKKEKNRLFLSKIEGKTLAEIFSDTQDLPEDIIVKLFEDLNLRHELAIKYNEPKLCHIDANLKNILYYNKKIFHVDFEMGREKEDTSMWMEREISKLLVSLLQDQSQNNRETILKYFTKIYQFQDIVKKLIEKKLNHKRFSSKNKKRYSLLDVVIGLKNMLEDNKKYDITFPVNKIMVIYSARFGDILMSTPTVRAIKERWPEASITFMTHPDRTEILENIDFIDEVFPISKIKAEFLGRFTGKKYDLAFVLNKTPAFVKYALRVSKEVIAFKVGDKKIDNKLLYEVDYPKQHSKHSVDMRLHILSKLGMEPSSKALAYCVTSEESGWAKEFLKENDITEYYPLIGIQASSFHTKVFRDWPIENFIALTKEIIKDFPKVYFILFGGPDDLDRVSQIHGSIIEHSTILAGKLTLRQSAAIMKEIDLYVGVDTGPTHIMGTMNKPMVVMYHSFASSSLLKPLENHNFIAIDHPVSKHGESNTNMSDISVKQVFDVVKTCLKKGNKDAK